MSHRTLHFSFSEYLSFNEYIFRSSQGQSPSKISVKLLIAAENKAMGGLVNPFSWSLTVTKKKGITRSIWNHCSVSSRACASTHCCYSKSSTVGAY